MTNMNITRLSYASYMSYTPRPQDDPQRESKAAMHRLKDDLQWPGEDCVTTMHIARSMARSMPDAIGGFFDGKPVLVPVPRSSLAKSGRLWVPHNMAKALVKCGLGGEVVPCLVRRQEVRKSAWSRPEDRPTAAMHYDTMGVETISSPGKVLIVGDVVTRGATLMGAANRLRSEMPSAEIAAFAAMRVVWPNQFRQLVDPKSGAISLLPSGKTCRE